VLDRNKLVTAETPSGAASPAQPSAAASDTPPWDTPLAA
jgi:hypothetical protein